MKKKAQSIFNEWVRTRDCYETTGSPWSANCCTCGKEVDNLRGELHAGHWIKDTRNGNSTSFDEHNVHGQCKRCNRFLNGNEGNYAMFLLKKYGEGELDRLTALKHKVKKWTIFELENIIKEYRAKLTLLNE